MFKAVAFDLDGTLAETLSWGRIAIELGLPEEKQADIYRELYAGKITEEEARVSLVTSWTSSGKANRKTFSEMSKRLPFCDGAEETIKYLKSKGYILCIITGSPESHAKIMGERFGIDTVYSNGDLVFDERGELIDYPYNMDQANRKLMQIKDFLEKNNISKEECVAVGDSWNDSKMFEYTGNGVAIKHDTEFSGELLKVAWKRIDNLIELENIL